MSTVFIEERLSEEIGSHHPTIQLGQSIYSNPNMCTKVLLLLLCLSFSLALHYKQSIYNERSYLSSLNNIQNKYLADLQKLKERISRVKTEITQSGDTAGRIAIYQEALADQRDLLTKIQSYVTIPYDTKLCECTNFTEGQKSVIMAKILTQQAGLKKFKDDVAQRENCSNINELNREIVKEEQYMGAIKEIINSDCRRLPRPFIQDRPLGLVNLKEYLYISDLDTTKWIFGTLAESQYKYKMFVLSTKNNLTKCPYDRPFALSTKECIACPDEHPIWDLSSLQCTSCIPPEHYNPFGHNCTTKDIHADQTVRSIRVISINSNPTAQNHVGKPSEVNPVVGTCPSQLPFSDGSRCIKCELPRVFNYSKLQCEFCKDGRVFDNTTKECVVRVGIQNVTTTTTTTTTVEDTTAEGEFLSNLNARSLLISDTQDFHKIVEQQRELRNTKGNSLPLCPPDRPYYNGKRCIACYGETPLFDLSSKQCTNCIDGFTYFSNIHKCTKNFRVTNAQAPNLLETPNYNLSSLYQSIEKLRNEHPNNKIENCLISKPFERENECMECHGRQPLYNLETKECQRCSEGKYYDPHQKLCQKYSRITSPKAPNLYFKGTTKQDYEMEYTEAKESDPTLIDCPTEAPYFNGKNCIKCAPENPIFSVYVKLCGKCPVGRKYEPSTGECRSLRSPEEYVAPEVMMYSPAVSPPISYPSYTPISFTRTIPISPPSTPTPIPTPTSIPQISQTNITRVQPDNNKGGAVFSIL